MSAASTVLSACASLPHGSAECARVAQEAARTLARSAAARDEFDMHLFASELAAHFRAWAALDRDAEDAQRQAPADAVRALLGVLRNAVFEHEANQLALLAHWDAVAALMAYLVPFERMNDPTCASD